MVFVCLVHSGLWMIVCCFLFGWVGLATGIDILVFTLFYLLLAVI